MADLTIPKGDKGDSIIFTVLDASGAAYDLTTYTVKFKVWKAGFPDTLIVNGSCTNTAPTSGVCQYTLVGTEFTVLDDYMYELELTKTGVIISTVPQTLTVTESG